MGVPDWLDVVVLDSAVLAAIVVVLGFVALIALGLRRRGITRHAGTFECCRAHRRPEPLHPRDGPLRR